MFAGCQHFALISNSAPLCWLSKLQTLADDSAKKCSGFENPWSPKFYNDHRAEIEDHKKAQAAYSSIEGKMPTLKELTAEYDALKSEKEAADTALEELKPKLTTLNHIKYNFDILERDYLPEEKDLRREENPER